MLVTVDDQPFTLASRHHHIVAKVVYRREQMAKVARLEARDRGLDPREAPPVEALELGVGFMLRAWAWAEFLMAPDEAKGRRGADLYATAAASPPATVALPSVMGTPQRPRRAVLYRLLGGGAAPTCDMVDLRRNRTGDVDRLRRAAKDARGGRMLDRFA